MRTRLACALALCLLAALDAAARTQQPEPPVRLSLGVAVGPNAAPTFYPLPDEGGKGMGAYIGFTHLSSARFVSGPPVEKVVLSFVREGDGARVTVYAVRRPATTPSSSRWRCASGCLMAQPTGRRSADI